MAKTFCPWCHAQTDFIDTLSTKCPECLGTAGIEASRFVSRQTTEGVNAYIRARRHISE